MSSDPSPSIDPDRLPTADELCVDVLARLIAAWDEWTAGMEPRIDFLTDIAGPLWSEGVTGESRVAVLEEIDADRSPKNSTMLLAMEAACAFACEAHYLLKYWPSQYTDAAWYKLSEARYWLGVILCAVGYSKVEAEDRKLLAQRGARKAHEGHNAKRQRVLEWYEQEGHLFASKSAAAHQAAKLFNVTARTVMESYFPKGEMKKL